MSLLQYFSCVVSVITFRNAPQRTAIPPSLADSNCLRYTGGKPMAAASSGVTDFFATFFVERKTPAVRCVALWFLF